MKKYSIGSRLMSLLLAAVMLLTMVPVGGASAALMDEEGYLGTVKPLNNNESIALPIKLNNFAMDGMLFEYLSSVYNNTRDSQYYIYEPGGTYQLFSLHLAGKKVGVDLNGALADKDGLVQPDTDAMSGVDLDHSLTSVQGTSTPNYLGVTSYGAQYEATLYPAALTDGGGNKYLQLRQADRDDYAASGRTWRKLTRFSDAKAMSNSRYAVIIYRVNGDTFYDNMLLTWGSYDELSDRSNCSQVVPVSKNVNKTANSNWQYAIIDLAYNLGSTEEERAAAAANTTIEDIYLKSPLNYFVDGYSTSHKYDGVTYPATGNSMDLAAVAYFPYYGDAEQFVHYGLSLGCDLKYYYRDNRGFDFGNATRTSGNNQSVSSVVGWDDSYFGNQLYKIGTTTAQTLQTETATDGTTINTVDELGYALFGGMEGYATLGLLESQLDENGRPLYREVVVDFVAMYLQNRLTGVSEFPSDNYGWKNYSYVTGVSTTSEVDEHFFGKDSLGHSIDLGTALCNRVTGAERGSGTLSGTMGTYAESRAKADQLTGTWAQCEGNIKTWFDAAYYLLHNLYVSDEDKPYDGDGYGEYEDDLQNLIIQNVDYKDSDGTVKSAYAFDSGFCKNGDTLDTAVIYDRENHLITMDATANATGGRDPFLPASGNGTEIGETNSPYYVDDYVVQLGRGYRKRDYLYTISGNGFFQYANDLFFEFKGDDDVYLFINGELVLDIGGTHSATWSKIELDDYVDWAWSIKNGVGLYKGLTYEQLGDKDRARVDALALDEGGVYSFDFFYMERHGAGANLRIVTNIQVTGAGLNVDKTAYQNGIEIPDNGIVDVDAPIAYAFKVTNETVNVLYNFSLQDSVLGVSMDYLNGLVIEEGSVPYVRNKDGDPLTVEDLEITVSGKDADGNQKDVVVTCTNNDELKAFLTDLTSDDGTASGEGLWKDASIQIGGIYYTMTAAQKEAGNLRNYVTVSADAGGISLRGADDHTVFNGLTYYQWIGKPVVVEREKFYNDLLEDIVGSAQDLPALSDMILVPSDSNGIERKYDGIENARGGDVYLTVNYTVPGTYIAHVTVRDRTNPDYRLTVPVAIYAVATKDSTVVLDYGLDAYLTDDGGILDYELGLLGDDKVTGSAMGVAADSIDPSYQNYDTSVLDTAVGNTDNELSLLKGSSAGGVFSGAQYRLDDPVYLDHSKPWVVEFKVKSMTGTAFLFSAEENDGTSGNEYLFLRPDFIALGYYDGSNYQNYAVKTDALDNTDWHVFKMYNVIDGDGTNMVYMTVDGGTPAAMNNYYVNASDKATTDNTWISGHDFTFTFLGGSGRALSMNMEYLHVYEEGEQLTNFRWEKSGNDYICVDTQKPGYQDNPAEYYTYTSGGTTMKRWRKFNVTLNSHRAWEFEFQMQLPTTDTNFMLMSSTGSKTANVTKYIYIVPSKRYIAMGSDVDGAYVNYGAVLPSGFDMTQTHTYLLKNRVHADGTNMVYLYVDKTADGQWTEVGPLNCNTSGTVSAIRGTGLSGQDFTFEYIGGHDKFAFTNQVVPYIEVHEDTALRTAYEWVGAADGFVNVNPVGDGNRILFAGESSGSLTDGAGQFTVTDDRLKFEASDFMDQVYTAYTALAIHEKGFEPTALSEESIDIAREVQLYKKVSVIPANVVYYEDDFPAIHYLTGNQNVFTPIGTETLNSFQSVDQNTEYGSDAAYQNTSSTMSGDHICKIAVKEDDSALAWFDFKGTGFELVSSTNATDSAMIYIQVYDKDDVTVTDDTYTVNTGAEELAWIPLIPEFDQGNDNGTEIINQVPLIRWQREDDASTTDVNEALAPSEYVVIINAYATYDYSQTNKPMMDTYLYIDGIRIFQPMGYTNDGYSEKENMAIFDEVRDYIVDGKIMVCENTEAGVIVSSGTVTWTENFHGEDYMGKEYTGSKVTSVNDYLLTGPNNEVYMDGATTQSSLAFVVYRNSDEAYKNRELGLQIAARAIDAGSFNSTDASGLKAKLELGVTNASGTNSWMELTTLTSGTEQYISIPYELCPATYDGSTVEYNVVIRVAAADANIPAMVSFSSIKRTEGMELKAGIGEALTIKQNDKGEWVTTEGTTQGVANFIMVTKALAATSYVDSDEAVRGENFVTEVLPEENVPAILPQYPTLSFEDEVQYNIYYTVQNLESISLSDMGLITFDTENASGTLADATDVIPGAAFNGTHYIVRTNGIPAKMLGDNLYFKVYAKLADGSYVYSQMYHYSAKTFAENQLAGSDERVKPLVVAMLNYGAAAQQLFNYKTEALMNAGLTEEQRSLVSAYSSDLLPNVAGVDTSKVGAFVNNGGFTRLYPTVSFEGAFAINYYAAPAYNMDGSLTLYYWDAETYNNTSELMVENAAGSVEMVLSETGDYLARYTGMAAKEIGDTVYTAMVYESEGVTYCSGVNAYSLGSYCKRLAEDDAASAQQLAAATAVYGSYAEDYFGA